MTQARTMVRFASSILKWLCSRALAPVNAISAASRNVSSLAWNKGCRGARHHGNGGRDRQCGLSRDGHANPVVADLDREGARTRVREPANRFVARGDPRNNRERQARRSLNRRLATRNVRSERDREMSTATIRFGDLKDIRQPALVVNGIHDEMIPVSNSYRLAENHPNAVMLAYPDSGHGSLFQFHDSFTRQAAAFLASDSPLAPY